MFEPFKRSYGMNNSGRSLQQGFAVQLAKRLADVPDKVCPRSDSLSVHHENEGFMEACPPQVRLTQNQACHVRHTQGSARDACLRCICRTTYMFAPCNLKYTLHVSDVLTKFVHTLGRHPSVLRTPKGAYA